MRRNGCLIGKFLGLRFFHVGGVTSADAYMHAWPYLPQGALGQIAFSLIAEAYRVRRRMQVTSEEPLHRTSDVTEEAA